MSKLVDALRLAKRMCDEAHPKFNWGGSALDANAIDLLNRAPIAIAAALAKHDEARAKKPASRNPSLMAAANAFKRGASWESACTEFDVHRQSLRRVLQRMGVIERKVNGKK